MKSAGLLVRTVEVELLKSEVLVAEVKALTRVVVAAAEVEVARAAKVVVEVVAGGAAGRGDRELVRPRGGAPLGAAAMGIRGAVGSASSGGVASAGRKAGHLLVLGEDRP